MRVFAMYLPQFHEVEDNNKWWGKGFTEWTHVKSAKPLYRGHQQPIRPQNGNYYNLLQKETVQWQTDLMRTYGVDGMVYYHYYFTGKKLLEKPAENLLKWKDIDQPFFFCWANHSWYRAENGKRNLLIEQQYGDETDWEEHFSYLLPFFQDARYEKKDNKPVLMLFADFSLKKQMMAFFDKRCKEEGFNGIYLIETVGEARTAADYYAFRENACEQTHKFYMREPSISVCAIRYWRKFSLLRPWRKLMRVLMQKGYVSWVEYFSGNQMYYAMSKLLHLDADLCHGLFFSWDNTPRHGTRGYVISEPKEDVFLKYAKKIEKDDYVFINAWNEWAEGMILEPTEHAGLRYLEWIKHWRNKEV